jgi:hypothetical protein
MIQQMEREPVLELVVKDTVEEMQEEVTTQVVAVVQQQQELVALRYLMVVLEYNIQLLVLFIGLVVAEDLAIQQQEVMVELAVAVAAL